MLGGAFWIVKGVAILLTGDQPRFLFEIAPIFFALGLIGLHTRLDGQGGSLATVGLGLAVTSGVLAIVGFVATFPMTSSEDFSPLIFGSFLAHLIGLVILGIATRRTRALPGRWRVLPLVMGVSIFPLLAVGGILESINERLLELPLVLIGLPWILLGYHIWSPVIVHGDASGPTV